MFLWDINVPNWPLGKDLTWSGTLWIMFHLFLSRHTQLDQCRLGFLTLDITVLQGCHQVDCAHYSLFYQVNVQASSDASFKHKVLQAAFWATNSFSPSCFCGPVSILFAVLPTSLLDCFWTSQNLVLACVPWWMIRKIGSWLPVKSFSWSSLRNTGPSVFMIHSYYSFSTKLKHDVSGRNYTWLTSSFFVCQCPIYL